MLRLPGLAVLVLLTLSLTARAAGGEEFVPEIPYTKHILPNGLTLIVHEDRKVPVVAVNLWYHIGSKDERPGRTGFAHLFEHLMFNGSENHDDEFFRPLEAVGAGKMNGTTWFDRTNYFENVPTSALDLALWLESDRMGHLLGAITQEKLDEQRGVVLNEKRQGENRPYGKVFERIAAESYPAGHPYSWTAIGSVEDLNAATLDDVKQWFRDNYGAANAVLVVAGDVRSAEVLKKVEHYFGDIPAGPARSRRTEWIAKMQGSKRMRMQDRVPQHRIFKVWNVPGFCSRDANVLNMAADVLAGGKTSRLYKRLVYDEQIATSVRAGIGPFEIGSQFMIDAMVAPGADPKVVERAIDEELRKFLKLGPTKAELARVRTGSRASFIRSLERVDGFGGKSATLAKYEVYCGSPDWYQKEFTWIEKASPRDVRKTAQKWLSDGELILTVEPFPEFRTAKAGADRSRLPDVGPPPPLELPALQRGKLSNGIPIFVAERRTAPVVQIGLLFDAGHAADSRDRPGIANMTLAMLDEGVGDLDAIEFARRKEELATTISAGSNLDTSLVSMNALTSKLPESMTLLADTVRRPSFPEAELERLRSQTLAAIQQEKSQPNGIASRIYPALIYGAGHPYAGTRSGRGSEASVAAITTGDLRAFHARWVRPDNARILVVGDIDLDSAKTLLEASFGDWTAPKQPKPVKQVLTVAQQEAQRVFLVHKPDATQALVLGAHLAPPRNDPDDAAMNIASSVLGGLFVSRLNLNLREDKHWSYGARSQIGSARGQRPMIVAAQVQSDKTADSIREMIKELRQITGDKPITPVELKLAADNLTVGLPGDNETSSDLSGTYSAILQYGLKDSYFNDLIPEVQALTVSDVNAAARKLIKPDSITWLVIGDLSDIEAPIRALGLGEVRVLDQDGSPVQQLTAADPGD